MHNWLSVLTVILQCLTCGLCDFNLTIMHTGDLHAKIQELAADYGDCTDEDAQLGKCFGGQARMKTKITELRARYPDSILVDAGNQYQGSLFFYFFGGRLLARFMNELGYDAMTLGNHDFDRGPSGLSEFLLRVEFTVVSTNLDLSYQEELIDVKKREILYIRGQAVGIVGYLTPRTQQISDSGKVKFLDMIDSVQQEVDKLTEEGVSIIVALAHAGYVKDMEMARVTRGIDVIVGAHDHSFLYTGTPPSTEKPWGPYPTVVENRSRQKVLVVNGFAWGKYLGFLNVGFDADGVVQSFHGNPVLLDHSVPKDPGVVEMVKEYLPKMNKQKTDVRGRAMVHLDGDIVHCRVRECNLGNLVADAMVDYYFKLTHSQSWNYVAIALIPAAMFRLSIPKGKMPVSAVLQGIPYWNSVDRAQLLGSVILAALEHSATHYVALGKGLLYGGFLQVSGLRIVYNMKGATGKRVVSVRVKCTDCRFPVYERLNKTKMYQVVMASFLVRGGEGYTMIRDNVGKSINKGPQDSQVLLDYIEKNSPVYPTVEGRIQFLQDVKKNQLCDLLNKCHDIKPSRLLTLLLSVATIISMLNHFYPGRE